MKVLAISYLFPNSQYPNYGIFVLNRLMALQQYCEVTVINPIPWFPYTSRLARYQNFNLIPRRETLQGLDVLHPRFPIVPKFFKSFDAASYAAAVVPLALRLRKVFPFDLIDLHWTYPDLPSGAILSEVTNRPFLTTVRGHEAFYLKEPGLRKTIVRRYLKKSSAVIALSQQLKDEAVGNGCSKEQVKIIRNGVDHSRFTIIPQGKSRARLGIARTEKVILAVGSLIQGKGIDRIISSLQGIIKKHSNVRLYLVGSEGAAGFYKNELIEQIHLHDLKQYVHFVGEVKNTDLVYWYNAADVFCLASRREGSPNVLTEALCCGCPAVATDVGSVSEIMPESYLGCIIPNQDDILDGLLRGLDETFNRRRIADYMRRYDWNWCARQVFSLYTEVLAH